MYLKDRYGEGGAILGDHFGGNSVFFTPMYWGVLNTLSLSIL